MRPEGRVSERRGPSRETDETHVKMVVIVQRGLLAITIELDVAIVEALQGLGPLVVEGWVMRGSLDALEAVDGSHSERDTISWIESWGIRPQVPLLQCSFILEL